MNRCSFQLYKFLTVGACGKSKHRYSRLLQTDVTEVESWFNYKPPSKRKQICKCFDKSLTRVMKLLACCEIYSRYLAGILVEGTVKLFCENDGTAVKTSACQIARILAKKEEQDMIFSIIREIGMCEASCPLNMAELGTFSGTGNLDLEKRQFDIASTNNLFQEVCMYTDEEILQSLVHGPGFSLEVQRFFSYTLIMRGSYCCLLL